MIWALVRKELLANLLTARLGLAVVFAVVLTVLATWIGSIDYARNYAYYEEQRREHAEELAACTTWRQLDRAMDFVLPPQPLGILSRGLQGTAATGTGLSVGWVPVMLWQNTNAWNVFLNVVGELDATSVVAVLLSFLAVVLGFDGISSERERGTLKLLLANAVPRSSVVIAKLIGGAVSLSVPLALAFAVSLLILVNRPDVVLRADDWLRLVALFGLSCLFLVQVFALSLMVSACVRESSTSLIICLFAWLVGSIGYINLLPSLSRYGVYERPSQEFRDAQILRDETFGRQLREWEQQHPPPGPAWLAGLDRNGVDHFVHPVGLEWMVSRTAYEIDKSLERADAGYRWWPAPLAAEARLIDDWAILSPVTNYQLLAYQVARTTFADGYELAQHARDYRRTWIDYLRGKEAFSSPRWLTDDPVDQPPMIPYPESVTEAMLDPDSPFMRQRTEWAEAQLARVDPASRSLDLRDMPRFHLVEAQRDLGETLGAMTPGLVVLLLTLGGSVLLTFRRFGRTEPH